MRSLADANAIPARAAPCVIFAASITNRNRRRSTKSKRMEVFMRSSRLRHCLRQCSTPRPSPDNLAFAAHDLCVGSADACNGAGGLIPASRAPRFARPADCGGSAHPSEFGEIDAGQPDIRTSAPCQQGRVLQMWPPGAEDLLYFA